MIFIYYEKLVFSLLCYCAIYLFIIFLLIFIKWGYKPMDGLVANYNYDYVKFPLYKLTMCNFIIKTQ